jgi:alpha-beta hydrolase superfamily lysophospholipase
MSSSGPRLRRILEPHAISVESFDTTPIHYDLYDAPSKTLVLIVPGFWRDRRHASMVRLANWFVDDGYRTAICDLRGHGDSGGTFSFNLHEHYDIAAVVNDLLRRCAPESITIIGLSYGGAIAISAAARHKMPLASMLLISSVADFAMVSPRINPLTIHRHIMFTQAIRRAPRFDWHLFRAPKLRAVDDVADIHAPLSLIHVKNDWLIDHTHSVALYERANEPKELHIIDIPGNYHADRIFLNAATQIEPLIADFLARYSPK